MRNRRAIFSVIASSIVLALTAVACEEDKSSEFDDQKLADADVPDRDLFNIDGATPPEGGAPVECKPSLPGQFDPVWKSPSKQEACSEDQITKYFDGCLDLDNDKTLASQSCKDFHAENKACADCIERDDNTGPVKTFRDRYYYEQNYPHCVALIQKEKGRDETCGQKYFEYEECVRQSCDSCFDVKGSVFQDYTDCLDKADDSGECKRRADEFDDNCFKKGYKVADGGAPECFAGNGRKPFFLNIIKLSCLKP
ncbi:MAG: hypothetical protein KIT84_36980 [Labilithrix sp.]|nr:hypothetical protein [Labilithrix sp.]MCW5816652.1 hypothetical protein [Labilithrix sp.]